MLDSSSHQITEIWSLWESLLDKKQADRHLEILELGSGCGIVGIGLARMIPNAHFILTDLPEAMEILQKNISMNADLGLAPGTTLCGQVLDWDTVLKRSHDLASLRPDLVLVSDCTYNPSSFNALIATLLQLVKQAHQYNHHAGKPKLDVLVSYKTRHESESQFFKDIDEAGFEILAKDEVILRDRTRARLDLGMEKAEMYAFGLRTFPR